MNINLRIRACTYFAYVLCRIGKIQNLNIFSKHTFMQNLWRMPVCNFVRSFEKFARLLT